MGHHERDLVLVEPDRGEADGLGQDPADEDVVLLAVGLLLALQRVAVEHAGPSPACAVELDPLRQGELGAPVGEDYGEDPAEVLRAQGGPQPVEAGHDLGSGLLPEVEAELQVAGDEMEREDGGQVSLRGDDGVHLHDGGGAGLAQVRLEVVPRASDVALPVSDRVKVGQMISKKCTT